jgi:hypothetical protein
MDGIEMDTEPPSDAEVTSQPDLPPPKPIIKLPQEVVNRIAAAEVGVALLRPLLGSNPDFQTFCLPPNLTSSTRVT